MTNANNNRIKNRVTLSIRCSHHEAAKLRDAAKRERRSLSNYVLHALMNRLEPQQRISGLHRTTAAPVQTDAINARVNKTHTM